MHGIKILLQATYIVERYVILRLVSISITGLLKCFPDFAKNLFLAAYLDNRALQLFICLKYGPESAYDFS